MTAHQAFHCLAPMACVLGVSPSGYYAWRKRPLSVRACADVELTARIQAIHRESRGTYGVPRVHAELAAQGIRIGRKRVARLMRGAHLHGVSRRKQFVTTRRDATAQPAPDLVNRHFQVAGPNQLWVADITYIATGAGFLYLAVVLDAWSRRVVGWAMAAHLRTELVMDALDRALRSRRPQHVIHHSDHGCQYTSIAFGLRCREAGVQPSMGSVGDAYDNALCESFFATLDASYSTAAGSPLGPRPSWPSSTTSKAGTIPAAGIPRSPTCRRWCMREPTRRAVAQWHQDRRSRGGPLSP
jgi:putative transposase